MLICRCDGITLPFFFCSIGPAIIKAAVVWSSDRHLPWSDGCREPCCTQGSERWAAGSRGIRRARGEDDSGRPQAYCIALSLTGVSSLMHFSLRTSFLWRLSLSVSRCGAIQDAAKKVASTHSKLNLLINVSGVFHIPNALLPGRQWTTVVEHHVKAGHSRVEHERQSRFCRMWMFVYLPILLDKSCIVLTISPCLLYMVCFRVFIERTQQGFHVIYSSSQCNGSTPRHEGKRKCCVLMPPHARVQDFSHLDSMTLCLYSLRVCCCVSYLPHICLPYEQRALLLHHSHRSICSPFL